MGPDISTRVKVLRPRRGGMTRLRALSFVAVGEDGRLVTALAPCFDDLVRTRTCLSSVLGLQGSSVGERGRQARRLWLTLGVRPVGHRDEAWLKSGTWSET